MPVFFLCFIVFIIWMRVKTKQESAGKSTWDMEFWKREREADFARKKSIADLDYLSPDRNRLPFRKEATELEKEYQDKVEEMLSKKMINLSGKSNTDIKLEYGTANFPVLSTYDQTFALFLRNLSQWGQYLQKETIEQDNAQTILEYAIDLGSDITGTYVSLAQIYSDHGEIQKIQELIDHVADSDAYLKDSIIRQLTEIIRSYH